MSHTIVGIDLGAYTVKFAMVEAGLRQARMAGSFEEEVPPGDARLVERQGEALQRGLARLPQESTMLRRHARHFAGHPGPGPAVLGPARNQPPVVGYELEGQIVHALPDVVFNHVVLRAPAAEGTGVLTVAAKLDDVGGFLAELGVPGDRPRALYASPVVYQALMEDEARADDGALPPCRMVLDIGHLRTNVCIVQGSEAIFGRTILRGGAALTAAIGRAYQATDEGLAMRAKHSHASVGSPRPSRPDHARGQHTGRRAQEALAPFLRDVRQTLASVRSAHPRARRRVLLTGGGAELRGLVQYLQEELELSVSLWAGNAAAALPGEARAEWRGRRTEEVDTRFSLASAIAWAGARGPQQIDLRRGPFVYRASFSLLRQKALHLGALAAGLVIALTLDAGMALARLGKQRDRLPRRSCGRLPSSCSGRRHGRGPGLEPAQKRGSRRRWFSCPRRPPTNLLDEVSRKLPLRQEIKLDVYQIDIRPKKVFIEGTVDSAAAVDEMVAKLNGIECFEGDAAARSTRSRAVRRSSPSISPRSAREESMSLRTTARAPFAARSATSRPRVGPHGAARAPPGHHPRGRVGGVLVLVVGFLIVQRQSELSEATTPPGRRWPTSPPTATSTSTRRRACRRWEMQMASSRRSWPPISRRRRATSASQSRAHAAPGGPAGQRYLENTLDVTLRQVNLLSLAKFLSKVETGPRLIIISKMSVRRGFADGEKLNVTLTATAYERVKDTKKKAGGKEKT